MSRSFHLGDVLSVTTGKLVSPRLIEGVYDILNYMTGDSLFTHQLPRASRECAPWLLRQHPELATVDASGVTRTTWRRWLAEQIAQFGDSLEVEPPLTELREMVPDDKIIVIDPDDRP
jgi:hypothetical protein